MYIINLIILTSFFLQIPKMREKLRISYEKLKSIAKKSHNSYKFTPAKIQQYPAVSLLSPVSHFPRNKNVPHQIE